MRQSAAISLLIAASASLARDLSLRDTDCKDVHIFLAKGNNEPYPGRQGKLVTAICDGLSSCDYEDIKFYNPLESVYCDSVFEGAANGIKQITAYNKACPDSKLVVSGYSQGGHVVGDILGGGGGTFFQGCVQNSNEGLDADSAPGNMIVAAAIFGDTRHTANQPYNVFSGAGDDGLFPRTEAMLAKLVTYGNALHNYCVETDPICAGGDVVADHLNYFDLYSDTVAEWVHERIEASGNSTSTTSSAFATSTKTTKTKSETATEATTTTETGSETASETESASATKTRTTTDTTEASTTVSDNSSQTTAAATTSAASGSEASASDSTSAAEVTTSDSAGSRNSQLGAVVFALGAVLVL
ncbi:Alpha/Beta hydrolase protein [Dactylonectria macrodidyma]|uniref:Cutinase n=1 Tax=Dactylonectria macrodidyma TaxID=307937 RepID=A0A9P9FTA2_9HYPO|nr:Alpha/Beta hydrolase protein [Dactylonectria macrodidyma]